MIKVYFANIELLEKKEGFSYWFDAMHPMRKEKVLRCKQEIDKNRSLLAGVLLKIALEKEGLDYETLEFALEEHGRPVLKNIENLYFSLSHAGNYALCCISNQPVGADMESKEKAIFKEEKAERMHTMAKKVLSENEYEEFLRCDETQKACLFLQYWTRKESYSKAFGEGLRMDFSSIDTESMIDVFWSDWLEKDCFASIYTSQEAGREIEFHRIVDLMNV